MPRIALRSHHSSAVADRASSLGAIALILLATPFLLAVGPSESAAIDTQAPTIVAHRTPSANAAGWNNTPVSIWFTCSDNVAGVRCPEQVILEESGRNQLVTGTATDAAGHRASASVTVSLDREAPVVALTSAVSAETTRARLDVTASVEDAVSGQVSGGCNGALATIVAGSLECMVTLKPGRNIVLVHAVDAAGNTASASSRTVRVRAEDAALQVTPAAATISVGDNWPLVVVDQFGRRPSVATWSTNDQAIAIIETGKDGAVSVAGVAPGVATITATVGEATATMRLVVLSVRANESFPKGTVRWSAPQRAGIADSETFFAGGDALYSIEYPALDHRRATIRAYSMSGNENWMGALPIDDGETVLDAMVHASGGMLFVTRDVAGGSSAVVHYGSGEGRHWRYQSSAYTMQAVTGGDGTVFIVEHSRLDSGQARSQIVLLDGAGNAVVKQILPQLISKTQLSSGILTDEPPSNPAGLMVDARGHARFMIAHGQRFASRSDNWVEYALDLYAVAPDGSMQAIRLDSIPRRQLTVSSDYYLRPEALIPDGEGVLALYSKRDESQGEQWHGKYLGASRSAFTLPEPWRPTVSTYDGFGVGRNPSLSGPLVARNLRTGALHWQRSIAGIAMLGITGGGAAVRDDLGGVRMVEATGPMEDVDDLAIGPGQYIGARFHVRDAHHTLRAVVWKPLNDGTVYTAEEADGRRRPAPLR